MGAQGWGCEVTICWLWLWICMLTCGGACFSQGHYVVDCRRVCRMLCSQVILLDWPYALVGEGCEISAEYSYACGRIGLCMVHLPASDVVCVLVGPNMIYCMHVWVACCSQWPNVIDCMHMCVCVWHVAADDSVAAKILSYNRANRAVAVLCNHQRAVPKTFAKSMENLQNKVGGLVFMWKFA